MKEKFYCKECELIFEAEGARKEYHDPVFGPCMKYIAMCPGCNLECTEYRRPKVSKSTIEPELPSCSSGSCCYN